MRACCRWTTWLHAVVCGLIVGGAILLNQSAAHWRANIVDDHLFAYFGWCVTEGARPYLDIWDNKPPGIWWLNAAAIRVCGPGVGSELLLGSAALAVACAAFVGIARLAFHRSLTVPAALVAAVLLTNQCFECGGNRTETYVVACEALAVYGYLRWLRHGRYLWLVVFGLLGGAAPLFKQSGLAAAVACAAHFAWVQWCGRGVGATGRRRPWHAWVVGGVALVVAPLVASAVLTGQGALGEALFAVGRFNRAYFAINDATWLRVDRAIAVSDQLIFRVTGVYFVAAVGAAAVLWRLRTGRRGRPRAGNAHSLLPRPGPGLFLLWFMLAAYLACVGPGRRAHHFMPILPALGLLFLYPLHLMVARRGLRTVLIARPSAAAVLAGWLQVLAFVTAASMAVGELSWRTKPHWYSLRRQGPASCEAQAAEIMRLTQPADRIYVWGWSPGTYRYAYRLPASRFATIEKVGQVGAHAAFIIEGVMRDVRRDPPRVFVISERDSDAMQTPPASEFSTWLQAHYENVTTVEGMQILRRLDKATAKR